METVSCLRACSYQESPHETETPVFQQGRRMLSVDVFLGAKDVLICLGGLKVTIKNKKRQPVILSQVGFMIVC